MGNHTVGQLGSDKGKVLWKHKEGTPHHREEGRDNQVRWQGQERGRQAGPLRGMTAAGNGSGRSLQESGRRRSALAQVNRRDVPKVKPSMGSPGPSSRMNTGGGGGKEVTRDLAEASH